MDTFLASLTSRAAALKTDDELRAEFKALALSNTKTKAHQDRFDASISERAANRAARNDDYTKARPDAQKGRI